MGIRLTERQSELLARNPEFDIAEPEAWDLLADLKESDPDKYARVLEKVKVRYEEDNSLYEEGMLRGLFYGFGMGFALTLTIALLASL